LQPGGPTFKLLTLFKDGGFMMYPLILCSLVALGVIIAKAWTLWVAHRESRKLLREIEELGVAGRLDAAIDKAAETPGPVAAILLAGLRRVREEHTEADIQAAINTTGNTEVDFLERGLVVLATIANVAPMLGFLGTVIGMILAFAAIEQAGQVEPTLVAGGIKVALITTAAGLTIAIPVNVAYNFFVTRIDKLLADMEEGSQTVLDLIWKIETGQASRGPAGPRA
jgi:biopolymer transport protein ExbB